MIRIARAGVNTLLKFSFTSEWFKEGDFSYQCLALQTIECFFTCVKFFPAVWTLQATSSYKDNNYQLKMSHCREWASAADESVDYSSQIVGIVDQPLAIYWPQPAFLLCLCFLKTWRTKGEYVALLAAGSWPVFVVEWVSRRKVFRARNECRWSVEHLRCGGSTEGKAGRGRRSQSMCERKGNPPIFPHLHICCHMLLLITSQLSMNLSMIKWLIVTFKFLQALQIFFYFSSEFSYRKWMTLVYISEKNDRTAL